MKRISLQDFFHLCPPLKPTHLLILLSLSESMYPEVWVSEAAIAKKLNISTKTVQRVIKKLEERKFLSVKRSPRTTGEVNRYSLNYDVIRKAIEKAVYGFDSGLSKLLGQVQAGKGNKKFRDFLDRYGLIDSAGTVDMKGLSSVGTTLAEISEAMNADTQSKPEPREPVALPAPAELSEGEYSGTNTDRKHLCPEVKELFLKVRDGETTHPAAVNFFKQSYFKALWDAPDSKEAERVAADYLGELYMNGLDAVVTTINIHFSLPEDGKFELDV